MLNEVLENIKSRRSVRTYTEQQVSAENLNLITTVQRNYPIGSVDLNRNHSSDVLV